MPILWLVSSVHPTLLQLNSTPASLGMHRLSLSFSPNLLQSGRPPRRSSVEGLPAAWAAWTVSEVDLAGAASLAINVSAQSNERRPGTQPTGCRRHRRLPPQSANQALPAAPPAIVPSCLCSSAKSSSTRAVTVNGATIVDQVRFGSRLGTRSSRGPLLPTLPSRDSAWQSIGD